MALLESNESVEEFEMENKNEVMTNGYALIAFVFGVLSVFMLFGSTVIAIVIAMTAIIFGKKGINEIRRLPERYRGLSYAQFGFYSGIFFLAIHVLSLVALFAGIGLLQNFLE